MFANPLHPESARTKTARLRRLALIGACLAFVAGGFSGVVAGPASAAYVFDAKWGSNGTGDGQFVFPTDLAIDGSGNVYVSDSSTITNRIQKFDSGGVFLTKWGSSGDAGGQFESPFGVAVDAAGDDVYVADSANNRIQRFDSSGTFERMWGRDVNQTNPGDLCTAASGDTCQTAGPILGDGHFQVPMGVATDAAGNNVYVADTSTNRIQKFDPAGTFDITWGFSGSGNGQFLLPNDVDTDADGSVYVADRDNNRIQKFNSAGNFVIKWGSSGSGDGQFAKPTGVATDADGNVYVADRDNNRIQKFNSAGLFLTEWGAPGVADGRFDGPEGLATDAAGNVYVVDTGNYRIQKFIEVAPETTIDSGPSPTTMDSTPSFTFSADQAGSSYECQTDDGGFGACTSPYATAPLIEGAHTFGVRAVNGGTPDPTPATRTFTVDTTAPDTTIDSGPTGTISFDEATFTFGGDPNVDIAGLECKIDSGSFADCTSPKTFTGLSEGSHTAEFRAEDTAGNQDPSPATRTFNVDTIAPDTTIDSGPTGTITTDEATFIFSSSEAGSSFECGIDGGGFSPCSSPKSYPGLSDGPHRFAVRAIDEAGNTDPSQLAREFTVDTTVYKARIGKVKVKGPAKAKKGKKATYKVTVSSSGNAEATGVKLQVKGKGVKAKKNAGTIPAGASKTVKVKLKFRKPGKVKATFKVTSSNAGGKTVTRKIKVNR